MYLVDLSRIVDAIDKKMEDGNFNFDKFEIEIILFNSSLYDKYIKILTDNYDVWKNLSSVNYQLFDFGQLMEKAPQLIKNYTFSLIDNGKIGRLFEESYLSDELLTVFKEYLKKRLYNSSYKPDLSYVGRETLKIIVETGRMDLLYKIQDIDQMYSETKDYLKNYYSNNNFSIPDALYPHLGDLDISFGRLGLKSSLMYLEKNDSEFSDNNFNLLLEKIRNSELLSNYKYNWSKIFSILNEEQKEELLVTLLEKGYYNVISQVEFLNENNYEKYLSKFIDSIRVNKKFEKEFWDISDNSNYHYLLNNSDVVKNLIESNKLLSASYSSKFKDFESVVVMQIINYPQLYEELNVSAFKNISEYTDILYALFSIGNRNVEGYLKDNFDLLSRIKMNILKGNCSYIPSVLINDDQFVDTLISHGYLNLISIHKNIFYRNCPLNLNDFSVDEVIKKAKEDCVFAMDFLNSNLFFVINNLKLLYFYLQANEQSIEIIINKINHLEENEVVYTNEMYYLVKDYFCKKYRLNTDNLDLFFNHFGPLVIRYISNENIQKIINMDDKSFSRFLALFPIIDFTMIDVEKIYDALKQYEFTKKCVEDIEIFARIKQSMLDNTDDYLNEIEKIISIFGENLAPEDRADFEKFNRKFNEVYPGLLNVNFYDFLVKVINYIKNGSVYEKNYYFEVLHFITNYYIRFKRELYRKKSDMFNDLVIPYELDSKDTLKKYIKYHGVKTYKQLIILEMVDRGIDEDLAIDCIDYYAFDKRDFPEERIKKIKSCVKLLIDLTNDIVRKFGVSEIFVTRLDEDEKINRKYYVKSNFNNIFPILSQLNIEALQKTILGEENDEIYQSLLFYINKYKLHLLPDFFKELMFSENIDLKLELFDVASFISYYAQIYKDEKKRVNMQGIIEDNFNLGFVSIMKYAEAYSSVSSVYNQILGIEDARLIKSNPKPNSATGKTQGDLRFKEAVSWTLKNYERTEVTVPAFNEIIEHDNKKLRVVVGNFTHPSTITYGERTGSCMRIGGVGESFFDFILSDKNGFHIRFEDPNTGEFISRVSGFRNGNTVFLNELRYSCNPNNYSNEDLVFISKIVGEIFIEKTKDSDFPIDNVVLHNAYATEGLGLKEEYLNIVDSREGLPRFYSDIKDKGIVLASTEVPFKKIDFEKSMVPVYLPAREECLKSSDVNKLRILINRVHSVKSLLSGIGYHYLVPLGFENGIYYGIANQDFYIYIDNLGNIYEEIIDIDNRASVELEEARRIIFDIKLKGEYLNQDKLSFGM